MLSIHHYNVAVHDLDEAVADYTSRFGMAIIGERAHNALGNFDYQALGFGDQVITRLITPSSEESPVARLMKERSNALNPHGEGFYMVAFAFILALLPACMLKRTRPPQAALLNSEKEARVPESA